MTTRAVDCSKQTSWLDAAEVSAFVCQAPRGDDDVLNHIYNTLSQMLITDKVNSPPIMRADAYEFAA
mgnify:CR=1 FL=1